MPNDLQVKEILLSEGEIFQPISDDQFRALPLNDAASVLVKVKQLQDFFRKLYQMWEPLVRGRMDAARSDTTQINQVDVGNGVKLHLGAGKTDNDLSQAEIEIFYGQFLGIDDEGAHLCFEKIHRINKAEINKLRKIKGEEGSMERKRSELIERVYNPQPKKLEIKGA